MEDRRTSPVELLWDLVFVFAVTQVTTLLANDLTWAGLARAMLVLALIWWAWSAFVWASNAQAQSSRTLTLSLLVATVAVDRPLPLDVDTWEDYEATLRSLVAG